MTQPDLLGSPYLSETLTLPDDYEGPVVATLVHRPADQLTALGAVLHVHGFCDYFFHTAMAEFYTGLGYDFYALDLRKYGRSLLPHQTPYFCRDLAEYDADLDAATSIIRERDGHERLLVSGHSTGGLIAPLWAAARSTGDRPPPVDGFILNSPWLDLQAPWLVRTAGTKLVHHVARRWPNAKVTGPGPSLYSRSLHQDLQGEWMYRRDWKPDRRPPVLAGWLSAIRRGQQRLGSGVLGSTPTLVLTSGASIVPRDWSDAVSASDIVLSVDQIAARAYHLSTNVSVVRVPGAIHDVFLSAPGPRADAFAAVERWLRTLP
jgi:alpha-beta hydrolase superfamily lysophospholipase